MKEAPDIREQDCPSHEACAGSCDLHDVLARVEVSYLLGVIRNADNTPIEILSAIRAVVRERLYETYEDGYGHAVAAEMDSRHKPETQTDWRDHGSPSRGPHVNPYGWTGH